MALNNSSGNNNKQKYIDIDSDSSEHYYQNQQHVSNPPGQRAPNNKKTSTAMQRKTSETLSASQINLNAYQLAALQQSHAHFHPAIFSAASNSSAVASSTASSDRPLLLRRKKFKISYFLLILGIVCLITSLISIAISFIFPFWIRLTLADSSNSSTTPIVPLSYLNLTNPQSNIALIVRNMTHNLVGDNVSLNAVHFDMGLWEVKMQQPLELVDVLINAATPNEYPQSMLWINYDLEMEDFLYKLLKFIDLKPSYIFIVQILQIIHFIFAFLSFCFTSFTLCLCTNHKSSLCWYLVCFILSLVAFLAGLAVIVMVVAWQTSPMLVFKSQQGHYYTMHKTFNWCFWLSVGINSSILLASLLILLYILITTIMLYRRKRTQAQTQSEIHVSKSGTKSSKPSSSSRHRTIMYHNQNVTGGGGGYGIDNYALELSAAANYPPANFYPTSNYQQHAARLPRIPANMVVSRSSSGQERDRMLTHNQQLLAAHLTATNNLGTLDSTMRSPSYIFYTGHGNYHKQEIVATTGGGGPDNQDELAVANKMKQLNYEPTANDFLTLNPPSHLVNYSFINHNNAKMSNNHQTNSNANTAAAADHPYSNVADQHDLRFINYK